MFWKWFRKKKPEARPVQPPAPVTTYRGIPVAQTPPRSVPVPVRATSSHQRSSEPPLSAEIIAAVQNPKASVRRSVVSRLDRELWAHSGYRGLVEKLARDPDRHVRVAAVRALRYDRQSAGVMADALTDPHLGVRLEAVRALGKNPSNWGTNALINILRGPDRTLHAAAAASLRDMHGEEVIDVLIEALSPSYTTITRRKAIRSLAEKRSPRGIEPILNAIADRNHNIQSMAARSLAILIGRLPQKYWPNAVQILHKVGLAHPHPKVKLHAAYGLALIGDASGADILREALVSAEPTPYLSKARVAGVLGKLP